MEATAVMPQTASLNLMTLDPIAVRQDLQLVNPAQITLDEAKLDQQSIATVHALCAQVKGFDLSNPQHVEIQDQVKSAVENLGQRTQLEAAKMSNSPMLKNSIATLAKTEDGGEIARTLVSLNGQILELDPSGIDFSKPGGFKRLIRSMLGSKVQMYFAKYEKADAIIEQIIQSLVNGRGQLARDNMMLADSQKKMRIMTIQLEKAITLGLLVDKKLEYYMNMDLVPEDPKRKFIGEELIFPLRQRITDLQQQLAVNQQGVLVFELIIRNNKELVKGVQRAELVTVTALNIAVAAALALANQKMVLKTLNVLNETTVNIIAGTASRLKTQGADIHKQSSGAMLDIGKLTTAFNDVKTTIDDISAYRLNSLSKMSENIMAMQTLNQAASQAISKMEEGNRMAPVILLDVTPAM